MPSPEGPSPNEASIERLIEEYLESQPRQGTQVPYRRAALEFLRSAGVTSGEALLYAQAADVARYRNELIRRDLSPSTINQRLAAVRGLYRRLLKLGRIVHNSADLELVEGVRVSDASRTEGLTIALSRPATTGLAAPSLGNGGR